MSELATDARPKRPKTGGRRRGTPNKATRIKQQALVDALLAERLTTEQLELLEPLDVMLRVMRSRLRAGDEAGALFAAMAAAPYRHARALPSKVRNVADDNNNVLGVVRIYKLPDNGRDSNTNVVVEPPLPPVEVDDTPPVAAEPVNNLVEPAKWKRLVL